MLGVRYLVELAQKRKQPLVLCIGVGTNSGTKKRRVCIINSSIYKANQDALSIIAEALQPAEAVYTDFLQIFLLQKSRVTITKDYISGKGVPRIDMRTSGSQVPLLAHTE